MRVLIICSGNAPNFEFSIHQAFVCDQVEALKKLDSTLQFDFFFIQKKGFIGYLLSIQRLRKRLNSQPYDCIHAHVALSGLLANCQRRIPVVTTFHGSDVNMAKLRPFAMLAACLSRRTIYISQPLADKAIDPFPHKRAIIPCGVDFDLFRPRNKQQSRAQMGLSAHKKYVLFSSDFQTPVKNYPLAKAAIDRLGDEQLELLELKHFTRAEVALLMCAVDVALLTSLSEGSPQFVKEALACNCPVVATDVGDIRAILADIDGCYLTTFEPDNVATALRGVLHEPKPIQAREHIRRFDNWLIAKQVRAIYDQLK